MALSDSLFLTKGYFHIYTLNDRKQNEESKSNQSISGDESLSFKNGILFIEELMIYKLLLHVVYPSGKPMSPHLLRYQGFAIANYSFTLGCLEAGATSTFAQLGLYHWIPGDGSVGNETQKIY